MKLTRRQVRRLINECIKESSNPQYLNENIVNFNKIRKRIDKLQANPDDTGLRADLEKDHKALKKKAADRKESIFKTRHREAQTLLRFLEEFLNSQDEAAAEAAEKAMAAAQELEQAQGDDSDAGGGDGGDGGGGGAGSNEAEFVKMPGDNSWEYALRSCVWYTRKTGSTKEYKLGPTSTNSGKYAASIKKLNSRFPKMIAGCADAAAAVDKDASSIIDGYLDDQDTIAESIDSLIAMIDRGPDSWEIPSCSDYWAQYKDELKRGLMLCEADKGATINKTFSIIAAAVSRGASGAKGDGEHLEHPWTSVLYPKLCYGGYSPAVALCKELYAALKVESEEHGFPWNSSIGLSEGKAQNLSRGSLYRSRYRRY